MKLELTSTGRARKKPVSGAHGLGSFDLSGFAVFLLIWVSGSPAASLFGAALPFVILFFVATVIWLRRPQSFGRVNLGIVFVFALLCLAHLVMYGEVVIAASVGFLVKTAAALLIVAATPDFEERYVRIMTKLAALSLLFWIPNIAGVELRDIFQFVRLPLGPDEFHIGLHNFRAEELDGGVRNMGMFWEPGAFAGYLILAAVFQLFYLRNWRSKRLILLVCALLSTQSTTGYIAGLIVATIFVADPALVRSRYLKIIYVPVACFALGFVYLGATNLSFITEKIEDQMWQAGTGSDQSRINRFGNLAYDLKWIEQRPLLGWSATPETRYELDSELSELIRAQGNGVSGFAIKFGYVGIGFFFCSALVAAIRRTSSTRATLALVITLFVLLNGEQFLNFPLFLCMMFAFSQPVARLAQTMSPLVSTRKSMPRRDYPVANESLSARGVVPDGLISMGERTNSPL